MKFIKNPWHRHVKPGIINIFNPSTNFRTIHRHPSLKKEGLDEVYGNKPYFCPVTKSGDGVSWLWQIF